MKHSTVIAMSVQRMVCTACGSEANASCNCGVSYVAKSVLAAEAIKANPQKSDRAIATDIGVSAMTVNRAREGVTDVTTEREGRDGKSYSLRQRITGDVDEAVAAIDRRRVFLRCAEDAARKAEQGAGLRDAKKSDINDEILTALQSVINAWVSLRDEILKRKGE